MNCKLWSLSAAQENIWLSLSLTAWGENLLSASPVVRRWTLLYLLPDSLVFSFSILWLDITDVSDTRWMDTHKVLGGFFLITRFRAFLSRARARPNPVCDTSSQNAFCCSSVRADENLAKLSLVITVEMLFQTENTHVCSTSIWIKLVGNVIKKLRPVFAWRSPADVFTPGLLGAVYVNHIVFLFVLVRLMRGLWS